MKTLEGLVVSAKMLKTVIVEVTRKTPHPLYKKLLKRDKKYKVDTGNFLVSVGDKVRIIQTRPLSKGKHFRIKEIISSLVKENEKVVARKTSRKRGRIKHDSA